jgi:hypothetical protein
MVLDSSHDMQHQGNQVVVAFRHIIPGQRLNLADTSDPAKGRKAMDPFKTRPGGVRPLRPLHYNVELLAHIVQRARRTESAVQHEKLMDWASNVIEEIRRNPKIKDRGRTGSLGWFSTKASVLLMRKVPEFPVKGFTFDIGGDIASNQAFCRCVS